MKRVILKFLNALSICTLLLVFLHFLTPLESKAQTEYKSGIGTTIGTSDSRLFTSIYETETTVTMKIMGLGQIKMNMFDFAVFYDPEYLQLLDTNNQVISTFGAQPKAGKFSPELEEAKWEANNIHKKAGLEKGSLLISAHETMNAIWFDCGYSIPTSEFIEIPKGEVKLLFEFSFQKVTANRELEQSDFGLGISTAGIVNYQAKFGADAHFIWYREPSVYFGAESRDTVPGLFMFRSGSSVKTLSMGTITPSTATLRGYFAQGILESSNTVLDTTGTLFEGTGKLRRDTVKNFGFIYSMQEVDLSIDEFSKILMINGTKHDVPSKDEIDEKYFTRTDEEGNDYEFYITLMEVNGDMKEDSTYMISITDLDPHQHYYAWAYTHYTYESSKIFHAVGNREDFFTSDCIPLNIVTVFTAKEPKCGDENGEIYVAVTGGSGSYEFSLDGKNYETFEGDTITGLQAGVYTIWVKDAIHHCSETSIGNIVLHNTDTDLDIHLAASNSSYCNSDGTGNGTLYISVTGGVAPYTYFIDGKDRTFDVVNGMINELSAGEYVVTVTDFTGCVASSNRVFINLETPTLFVELGSKTNTSCGESTGTYAFTVSGNKTFEYQLDGYPIEQVTYTGNNTTITLTELSAGKHILRVWDDCNEVIDTLEITNGDNNLFAFTYTTENELLSCDGSLIPGSIKLEITGSSNKLEYRITGSNEWLPLAAPYTIQNLHYGIYRVEVRKDDGDCSYEVNQITILRDIYQPISVGTIFAAKEPTCGNNNGEIYVSVTGGSGSYEFKTNDGEFEAFKGDTITGLGAGNYTIWVRDANNVDCSIVSIGNIVLHNGNSDMNLLVTPNIAGTCTSNDGILYVDVTGGKAPYKYYINEIVPGAEETIYNGNEIHDLTAGEYVVYVVDNTSCVASSDVVRITSSQSRLQVAEINKANTTCGSSSGSYTFKVTGTSDFTYQLDGFKEVDVTDAGTETTIVLAGLNAGKHILRVKYDCGEKELYFDILNGEGGLAFTATATEETLSCEGELLPGSITITVESNDNEFEYSINGSAWVAFTGTSHTINGLHYGYYKVQVRDEYGCMFEVNNVIIERHTSHNTPVIPPVATTPQTFCGGATIANLQATGLDITWYSDPTGGDPLPSTTELVHGYIYYAAQSVGFCESQVRTAVKVYIESEVELEAPKIESPQAFCQYLDETPLTIADIATNGNTNIVWYDAPIGGTKLSLSTELEHNTSYYAELTAGGTCQSTTRTEVVVTIGTALPQTPEVDSPQQFCDGAIISDIAVPHNQIVWYSDMTGGNMLPQTYPLTTGTYYAAYKTGGCESEIRFPVNIVISTPDTPFAEEEQPICGKATIADLVITGAGIVWYDENDLELPLDTKLVPGESYWAAQSSASNCVGEKIKITITEDCYEVYGTMFPFVYTRDPEFDKLFPVTVKLYTAPDESGNNPFATFKTPVDNTFAKWYDGSVFIEGTPANESFIGSIDNHGEPIDWTLIGRPASNPEPIVYVLPGDSIEGVGMFTFSGLTPGDYILEIARPGFLTRWAKITVDTHKKSLGHRELIAGDMNQDLFIDFSDLSLMQFIISTQTEFHPAYDLNASGQVDEEDFQIIHGNINAYIKIYVESKIWLEKFGY